MLRILGVSGQTTDAMRKFGIIDPLGALEISLLNRSLAFPPYSIGCFPYENSNPLLMETCPHVYFTANQDKFGRKKFRGKPHDF